MFIATSSDIMQITKKNIGALDFYKTIEICSLTTASV